MPGEMPITREMIAQQIAALANRSILWGEQSTQADPRGTVLLGWLGETSPQRATHLGNYAKWLVLVDWVFGICGPDLDLKKILSPLSPGLKNQTLRNLFDPEAGDKGLRAPHRYNPSASQIKGKKREEERLLEVLLDIFNEHQRKERLPEMKMAVLMQPFKLQSSTDTVGTRTILGFRHWLIHRQAMVNPVVDPLVIPGLQGPVVDAAQKLTGEFLLNPDVAHQVVASVMGDTDNGALQGFAAALSAALAAATPVSGQPYTVVSVSLPAGATRRSVLRKLLEQVCPDKPVAEDFALRPVDLATDLQELRDALTIQPLVILFEDWDNNTGPYGSLRDFICDSHWGEFIRCVVQPLQSHLLRPDQPDLLARVVVLSSGPVEELRPWLFVEHKLAGGSAGQHGASGAAPQGGQFQGGPPQHGALRDAAGRGAQYRGEGSAGISSERAQVLEYFPVALRFVAASVNGMQRTTLQRCLKQWTAVFGWTPGGQPGGSGERPDARARRIDGATKLLDAPALFGHLVNAVLKHDSIREVTDEELEGLSAEVRASELDRRPTAILEGSAPSQQSIQFRTRALNAEFLRTSDGGARQWLEPAGWRQVNFILAEESLRQATVQMRHLSFGAQETAQSSRRFMQTIYHGLACADLEIGQRSDREVLTGSQFDITLPLEATRRYRYLYSFIYRNCIEGGEWRLGRSFGRSDVRLDILTMFTVPSTAGLMLSASWPSPEHILLPSLYAPEPRLPAGGPALRCDLLEALGRAGLDAGTADGRKAVEWVLSVLPGWRLGSSESPEADGALSSEDHEINARLPQRGQGYQEAANAALKLRLDWLQSSGARKDLPVLIRLVREQLERMAIDPGFLDSLPNAVEGVIVTARKGKPGVTKMLLGTLEEAWSDLIAVRHNAASSGVISDVLYRLAEAYATQADNMDFDGHPETEEAEEAEKEEVELQAQAEDSVEGRTQRDGRVALSQFAQAGAIYWLADRMRARGGAQEDAGVKWPTAGGRGTRYYIRVCMKLARLIVDGPVDPQNLRASDLAKGLLDHAQSRLGLFTRHHFRYDRARVSGLLLESARIRSWVRVAADQEYRLYAQRAIEQLSKIDAAERAHAGAHRHLYDAQKTVARMKDAQALNLNISDDEKRNNAYRLSVFEQDLATRGQAQTDAAYALNVEQIALSGLREKCISGIGEQLSILRRSLTYLDEAESLLLSLGFQARHVRRLFLERTKFASTLVKVVSPPDDLVDSQARATKSWVDERTQLEVHLRRLALQAGAFAHLRVARLALKTLRSICADDHFWEVIHDRQSVSLDRAHQYAAQQLRTESSAAPNLG